MKNGVGVLIIDDTRWKIIGPDQPAGGKVKVTALNGQVLSVIAED